MRNQINIVYETNSFLVIDKPAGLLTHPRTPDDHRDSVLKWLLTKYPQAATIGDPERPGIVHRLDKETSGLLILTKTPIAYAHFKKLFHDRLIQKTYLALVYGAPKKPADTINAPLGKLGTRQSTRIHGKHDLKEKNAITDYRTLTSYTDYTLLEVKPKTGRTHQIRVHLASIGVPIVCDPLYRGKSRVCPAELGRMFLHAQKLEFTDPEGKSLALETDMPAPLSTFLETLA